MDEKSRLLLLRFSNEVLLPNLEPKDVVMYLYQHGLTEDDAEKVCAKETRSERVEKFVSIYKCKFHSLEPLISALRPCYNYIALDLENRLRASAQEIVIVSGSESLVTTDNTPTTARTRHSSQSCDSILRIGGVPQKGQGYIRRKNMLTRLKSTLKELSETIDEVGYALCYGMGGCGKSVIAADVLRDSEVVGPKGYFQSVFWVQVGMINPEDATARYVQIVTQLHVMLDNKFNQKLSSLDEGVARIRSKLVYDYPKCLVVFDDVWTPDVLRSLNFNCRMLITSRFQSLLDSVSGSAFLVPLDPPGFSLEETEEVFSQVLTVDRKELPEEVHNIYLACRGLPFSIFLVASLLKKHGPRPSLARWKDYVKKLTEDATKISGATAYEYANFNSAALLSINDLPTDLKDEFYMLAVFDSGIKVLVPVLATFWNKTDLEVEDIMQQFCERSLVLKSSIKSLDPNNCGVVAYAVHDLFLSLMKAHLRSSTFATSLKMLHQKLIAAYENKCPNGYHELPDDGYIFWYLASHLVHGKPPKIQEKMASAFLDLRFIQRKLRICGAANTLGDFVKFWNFIGLKEHDERKLDFKRFLSRNSNKFESCSVIQLALLEPPVSDVYLQAKNLVTMCSPSMNDELYLELINQTRTGCRDACFLACKPHDEGVLCAQFLPLGSIFVSGSTDCTVKMSYVTTGQEIATIGKHRRQVTSCCLSPVQQKIVVAVDRTLKLYDISRYIHQDLQSLRASTGSQDISTPPTYAGRRKSSAAGIHIEETELTDSNHPDVDDYEMLLEGHTEEVLWVEFAGAKMATTGSCDSKSAQDNKYPLLASCGKDRTIRIWDLNVPNSSACPDSQQQQQRVHIWYGSLESSQQQYAPTPTKFQQHCSQPQQNQELGGNDFDANDGAPVFPANAARFAAGDGNLPLTPTLSGDSRTLSSTASFGGQTSMTTPPSPYLVASIAGHRGVVKCVRFSPDGRLFASASSDHSVKIWSIDFVSQQVNLFRVLEIDGSVEMCAFVPMGPRAGQLAVLYDAISFYDIYSRDSSALAKKWLREKSTPAAVASTIFPTCFDLTHDGKLAAIGFSDSGVKILNTEVMEVVANLLGHASCVWFATFGPDSFLVSAAEDGVMIWNTMEVSQEHSNVCKYQLLNKHFAVAFLCNRPVLLAADRTESSKLLVIDSENENPLAEMDFSVPEGRRKINCVAVAPQNDLALLGLADGCVSLIEIKQTVGSDEESASLESTLLASHSKAVTQVAFSPDGVRFASAGEDGRIQVWTRGCYSPRCLNLSPAPAAALQTPEINKILFFHDNSARILSAASNSSVIVWDLDNAKPIMWKHHADQALPATDCDLSMDCSMVASSSADGYAKVWQVSSQAELFSERSTSGSSGGLSMVPNAPRTRRSRLSATPGLAARCVRFSPSGLLLAVSIDDGSVNIWQLATKSQCLITIKSPYAVQDLVFSPDEKLLVTLSNDVSWYNIAKPAQAVKRQHIPLTGTSVPGQKLFVNSVQAQCGFLPFCLFITVDSVGKLFILKRVDNNCIK